MSVRHALIAVVAAVHLTLAVCGVAERYPLSEKSRGGKLLRLYGELSGTDRSFGFFAPSVAPEYRATFTLEDADGNTWDDVLERGATREAALRINTMIETVIGEEGLEDTLARRWAQVMLRRHPRAVEVDVKVEAYTMPSMADYRAGARPKWETVYRDQFTPDDLEGEGEGEGEDEEED
jgi:hypothetical protein